MKLEQAAQQALEALEYLPEMRGIEEAITDLRNALDHSGEATDMAGCAYCNNPLFAGRKCNNCGREAEQAEQEPVAWLWINEQGSERLEWEPVEDDSKWKSKPLYAAPVRTKDLTDDEIKQVWLDGRRELGEIGFARAIEAKIKEKNRA